MVKAYFDFDAEKNAFEMRVQGHADFAELGKDPVCAGASVLAFTAAQVIDLIDRNQLLEESTIRISEGNVRLECRPTEKSFCRVQTVFLFAQIGMQSLRQDIERLAAQHKISAETARRRLGNDK